MATMHHRIWIDAEPETVYEALTTEEGLASWWTASAETDGEVGSTAVFGFEDGTVHYKMRIIEHAEPRRVRWSCSSGPQEWVGTGLVFDISPDEDEGGCWVTFEHQGWEQASDLFAMCNSTWGALMHVLKQHCEGDEPGPWFPG